MQTFYNGTFISTVDAELDPTQRAVKMTTGDSEEDDDGIYGRFGNDWFCKDGSDEAKPESCAQKASDSSCVLTINGTDVRGTKDANGFCRADAGPTAEPTPPQHDYEYCCDANGDTILVIVNNEGKAEEKKREENIVDEYFIDYRWRWRSSPYGNYVETTDVPTRRNPLPPLDLLPQQSQYDDCISKAWRASFGTFIKGGVVAGTAGVLIAGPLALPAAAGAALKGIEGLHIVHATSSVARAGVPLGIWMAHDAATNPEYDFVAQRNKDIADCDKKHPLANHHYYVNPTHVIP